MYFSFLGAAGLVATILSVTVDTPTISSLSLLLYEMWALPLLVTGANVLYALLSRRMPKGRARLIFWLLVGSSLLFLPQFAQMVLLLLGLTGVIRRRRAGKERQ